MSRYKKIFKNLKEKKEGMFIPFVVLGDPSTILSLQIIDCLIENGADALELGIPFSDPIADGPTIQKAMLRALTGNITVQKCFEMLQIIRNKYPDIPIGLLTYANLILNKGINDFYLKCSRVGIDSVLIADIPIEESFIFRRVAINNNIDPIFVCPPNADDILINNITLFSNAYIYLLSRSGVTGTENNYNQLLLQDLIYKFHILNSVPLIQGFGISKSTQIKNAIMSGITGVICGSAIVNIIEYNKDNHILLFKKLKSFISCMKYATRNVKCAE